MKAIIPSDDLLRLRELFLHWAPLFRLLELPPQYRLVLDANVVIADLLFLTKARRDSSARSSLQEAVDSGQSSPSPHSSCGMRWRNTSQNSQ
jgi:hypothetical protein